MTQEKLLDPFDVSALEKAFNDSATRVSNIWISFVLFSLYIAIATAQITQLQILFNSAIKLPALNVELPLAAFAAVSPILVCIFHLYVLVQVLIMARTAGEYNIALDQKVTTPRANAVIRQRLSNTLFAQLLSGSPRERTGSLGWILRFVCWSTLLAAPLLILFLDSRTKSNAVELIRKYLERCFVSKAFAWSSIEEPFDFCKFGIRHG